MEKVIIENGFFAREADPRSEIDRALLEKAGDGQKLIFEELDEAAKERISLYMDEMAKAAYIVSRPKAYEREAFNRYTALSATLFVLTRWKLIRPIEPISEDLMPMVYELKNRREKLVPLCDPEEGLLYIWGDDMPHKSVAAEADWRLAFDGPDFRPFLIPYLLDDQSAAKRRAFAAQVNNNRTRKKTLPAIMRNQTDIHAEKVSRYCLNVRQFREQGFSFWRTIQVGTCVGRKNQIE